MVDILYGFEPATVAVKSNGDIDPGKPMTVHTTYAGDNPFSATKAVDPVTLAPGAATAGVVTSDSLGRVGFYAADYTGLLYLRQGPNSWPVNPTDHAAAAQVQVAAAVAPALAMVAANTTALAGKVDKDTLGRFNVRDAPYNAKGDGVTDDKAAITAAMNAATAAGRGRVVFFPPGVYRIDGTLSMAGQTCQLQGSGGVVTNAGGVLGSGTTLKATNQTGPVIDFLGFLWPFDHRGKLDFGHFVVEGDGVSDPSKTHSGIRIGNDNNANSAGGAQWHDITVQRTGGPCFDTQRVYLCEFDRITCVTPVDAQVNNVPYFLAKNMNGCTVDRLGLRGITGGNDCGVGGAVVLVDDGTWDSYFTTFSDPWFEYLHPPTNGCLIMWKANRSTLNDPEFHDCKPVAGSTNTAWIRYEPSGVLDQGGNIFRGVVPGAFPAATDSYPTYGIVISQQRNRIEGIKGLKGTNVRLLPGSNATYCHLGGAETVNSTDAAFLNESGLNNHTLIDEYMGVAQYGPFIRRWQASGSRKGMRVDDAATPTNGALYLGSGLTAHVAGVGGDLSLVGNVIGLTDPSDFNSNKGLRLGGTVTAPSVIPFAGNPEGSLTAPLGSICLRTTGGGALYVKETGSGNTGWSAVGGSASLALKANIDSPTFTGTVGGITKAMVGLANAENTADANKPVSTATAAAIAAAVAQANGMLLTVGQETFPRLMINSTAVPTVSGVLRLSYFIARKTESATKVRVISGATAAAATPTLVRVGVYSVAGNTITLIGSTANTPAMLAAATTQYETPLTDPTPLVVGQMYAVGVLVVSTFAVPTLQGNALVAAAEAVTAPRLSAQVGSQTDLPASVASGFTASAQLYAVLSP